MRDHHDKIIDISRSALPSVRRRGARSQRAAVHRGERRQVRAVLHELERMTDPDEHSGDLRWIDRKGMDDLVGERRSADKLGPLLRWAERTVAASPTLQAATPAERARYFEHRLGGGAAGRHAASHVRSVLDPPVWILALRERAATG